MVRDRGVAVVQACRDLDFAESVLRRWMRETEADPRHAFPGHGQVKPEQQEIDRPAARQARRARATSGRSCSAARSDFFERQPDPRQRLPDRPQAHAHAALLGQPVAQLGHSRVRMLPYPRKDRLTVLGQS